jgi:hypothetical protein
VSQATIDLDLEQRGAKLVKARRPQLIELVRGAVDRELAPARRRRAPAATRFTGATPPLARL